MFPLRYLSTGAGQAIQAVQILHFYTENAGDIIITDKALAKK